MDWWSHFFDAEYMRLWGPVLEGRDGAHEARAAIALAGVQPPGRVLDVPCGFGRVAQPLAELGFSVVGVDLSSDMLMEARHRCRGLDVDLIEGDMRQLAVEGSFDAALCLFSSIGYSGNTDDDLRFFSAVQSHLKDGAALVIDSQHRDRRAAHPISRDWFEVDGTPVVTEGFMDWVTGIGGETVRWQSDGEWHERRFEVYHYTATELDRLLQEAGFTGTEFFGDLDGGPFGRETRMIAVAR
ncbi:MAG: class I SAM-dependent methyltransferase [bacterium]|nr:class I SAM-dependent methyltransferase [bacterium]